MDDAEQKFYFELAECGETEARNVIVLNNVRLVSYIVKKYCLANICMDMSDLTSIGLFGLIRAASTYKLSKGTKFATYASVCINNALKMSFREYRRDSLCDSLEKVLLPNPDNESGTFNLDRTLRAEPDIYFEEVEKQEDMQAMTSEIKKLTMRAKQILALRFGLNGDPPMTQRDVSQYLGISQSYVSRLEKKTLLALRKKLTAEYGII
jgi:RNA polymerase sporulation-specific sigma factor